MMASLILSLLGMITANPYQVGGQPASCSVTVNGHHHNLASTKMLRYNGKGVVMCYNGTIYTAIIHGLTVSQP